MAEDTVTPGSFGTEDQFLREKEGWNYVLTQIFVNLNKKATDEKMDRGYENGILDALSSLPDDSYQTKAPKEQTIRWAKYARDRIKLVADQSGGAFQFKRDIPDPSTNGATKTFDDLIFWTLDLNGALYSDGRDNANPVMVEMNLWRRVLLKRIFSNILSEIGWHFRVTPMGKTSPESLDRVLKGYKPRAKDSGENLQFTGTPVEPPAQG